VRGDKHVEGVDYFDTFAPVINNLAIYIQSNIRFYTNLHVIGDFISHEISDF